MVQNIISCCLSADVHQGHTWHTSAVEGVNDCRWGIPSVCDGWGEGDSGDLWGYTHSQELVGPLQVQSNFFLWLWRGELIKDEVRNTHFFV